MKKLFSLFAAVLCAGSIMATTYGAVKVTEVKAGELYVFAQTVDGQTYVMTNSVSSSKAAITTDFKKTGFDGNEAYVWTVESTEGGWFIKSANDSKYLNNNSKGNLVAEATGKSVWDFSFTGDFALISNTSNSNRFLGLNAGNEGYKAYAASNLDGYPHNIVVWKLEEGGTGSIEAVEVKVDTIALKFSDGQVTAIDYEECGAVDMTFFNFADYTEDGEPIGDGDILNLDFYPEEDFVIDGTYSIAKKTLDDEYTYLVHIVGTDTTKVLFKSATATFKLNSLDKEDYSANITVTATLTDKDGNVYAFIETATMYYEFFDDSEEAIENVVLTEKAQKVVIDGNVFVIRDNKLYNLQGTKIR